MIPCRWIKYSNEEEEFLQRLNKTKNYGWISCVPYGGLYFCEIFPGSIQLKVYYQKLETVDMCKLWIINNLKSLNLKILNDAELNLL